MPSALERAFLASPSTGLANPILAAPWVFTGEDNLRVVILNSKPGVVVTLDGRFVEEKAPGTTSPLTQALVPTADRLPTTFDFPIGIGFLLNISVVVTSGAPLIGQTYVMVQVIRGLSGATLVVGCLLGGYVTAMQHLAYPGSPIRSSTDSEPFVRQIAGTQPAAGAEWSETVPTGARWQVLSVWNTFNVSAAAGTRGADLDLVGAAAGFPRLSPATVMAPGTVWGLTWAPNLQHKVDPQFFRMQQPLPEPSILLAGDRLVSETGGFDVADQWGQPVIVVREWLEGA